MRLISKRAMGIGFGIGLLFLLLSFTPPAANLENQVFDLFSRWQADPAKWPEDVVLVLVDENALREVGAKYGWRWPWPRTAYAGIAAYLKKAGAREVLFDILFPGESEDTIHDDRFAAYLQAAGNVSLSVQQERKGPPVEPCAALTAAAGSRLGFVNVEKDADGVLRRYFLKDVWSGTDRKPLAFTIPGTPPPPATAEATVLLRWFADMDQLSRRGCAVSIDQPLFEGLAIVDAAKNKKGMDDLDAKQVAKWIDQWPSVKGAEYFRNKLVWIGCSAQATFDPIATPLSGHQPGVLFQATANANLTGRTCLTPAAAGWRASFIFLVAAGVTALCLRVTRIRWQVPLTASFLGLVFAVSYLCFSMNLWLPPLMAMVAGAASFTGVTAWQYFTEGKQKRWMRQLFSDFVSPDVLEELQQSPGGLNMRGDRRVGTVLFCDLAGFTTFTERAPPAQFVDAINAYLSEASRVLLARGAYIDKFMGDAVMAVFGIPKALPDHARQACLASIELQAMLVQLNERLGKQYQLTLGMRIGVNSGEMIAGPIGYARKLNYTVMGDTVNLASRLEGANKVFGSRIMIGHQTYELAKDALEVRFLDYLRVKGKKQPVDVYEIMARKGGLSPQQESLRTAYLEGIEQYRRRRWKEAQATFERALTIAPGDGPSEEYRDRCIHYQKDPPLEDWDGSFGLDHK